MDSLRRLVPGSFAVAAVFILSPLVDVVTNVYPTDPGSVQWRYGAIGIMSNYLVSGVFGLLLGTCVAALAGRRIALWIFVALDVLGAVVLLLLLGLFSLDVLQLRGLVQPDAADMFKIGASKAAMKLAIVAVALLILGFGGFRAARDAAGAAPKKGRKDAPLLVREE